MTAFRDYIPDFLAPGFLLKPKGRALLVAFGALLDEALIRTRDGVKARLPGTAARDSLGAIAFERGLPQGPGESDASWALRLKQAFDIWYWGGTAYGVLRALYTAGYAPKLYIGRGLQYELDTSTGLTLTINVASSTNMDFGQGPAFWSTFVVFFSTARWPAAWTTAGSPPAQGSDEARNIISLINRWKTAYATLRAVVMEGTSPVCGVPPPICGAPGLVCGGTHYSWTPIAPSTNLS